MMDINNIWQWAFKKKINFIKLNYFALLLCYTKLGILKKQNISMTLKLYS